MLGTLLNTLIPGLTSTVDLALGAIEIGVVSALPWLVGGALVLVNGLVNGLFAGF